MRWNLGAIFICVPLKLHTSEGEHLFVSIVFHLLRTVIFLAHLLAGLADFAVVVVQLLGFFVCSRY